MPPSGPRAWSFDQVQEWLARTGFEELCAVFAEHEVDGELLLMLDDYGLEHDLGIQSGRMRGNLLQAIKACAHTMVLGTDEGPQAAGAGSRLYRGTLTPARLRGIVDALDVSTHPMCKEHPFKECKLFCKTCSKPCCLTCVQVGSHQEADGHEYGDVSVIASAQRNDIHRDLDAFETQLKEMLAGHAAFHTAHALVQTQAARMNIHVNRHTELLVRAIHDYGASLSEAAQQARDKKLVQLEMQTQVITEAFEATSDAINLIHWALDQPDPGMLVALEEARRLAKAALGNTTVLLPALHLTSVDELDLLAPPVEMVAAFRVKHGLEALDSTWNLMNRSLTDVDALLLGGVLRNNRTLVTLYLGNNQIGDPGATALGEMLKTNSTLTTLYLNYNPIGDVGAMGLGEVLTNNGTFTELYLSNCQIGDVGATALGEMLRLNVALTRLDLAHNQIGELGATALAKLLQKNTTLTRLDLNCNPIGDGGAMALASMLELNSSLTTLWLGHSHIRDAGQQALLVAWKPRPLALTEDDDEPGLHLLDHGPTDPQ